jgi:hypothetical protein
MNTSTGWLGGHPESGDLLCFADRGMGASEQERLAAHLVDCEHCQRELAEIESMAHGAAAALSTVAYPPVSDIRRARAWKAVAAAAHTVDRKRMLRTVWLPRVAAASLVFFSAAAFSGPGLAMMRSLVAPISPGPHAVAPVFVAAPAEPNLEMSGAVSMDWSLPEFVVGFPKVGGGTIEFRESNGLRASVQVIGARSQVESGRSGVVIHNGDEGAPTYVIGLPVVVKQVKLSVGGANPVTFTPQTGTRYDVRALAAGRLVVRGGR